MNLWKSFDRLIQNTGPIYLGEVIDVNSSFGDVRCTVTLLPGGEEQEVTGAGRSLEEGQRWIVQDGKIVEEGPTGDVVYLDI